MKFFFFNIFFPNIGAIPATDKKLLLYLFARGSRPSYLDLRKMYCTSYIIKGTT